MVLDAPRLNLSYFFICFHSAWCSRVVVKLLVILLDLLCLFLTYFLRFMFLILIVELLLDPFLLSNPM